MTKHYGAVLKDFTDIKEGKAILATLGIFEKSAMMELSLVVWADVEIMEGEIESISFTGELEPHELEEGGLLDELRGRLERELPNHMKAILEFDSQKAYNFVAKKSNYKGNADCYFELIDEYCRGLVAFEI